MNISLKLNYITCYHHLLCQLMKNFLAVENNRIEGIILHSVFRYNVILKLLLTMQLGD